jgi:YD repeat-containing protein
MKKQERDHVERKLSESDEAPARPTGSVLGEFVTETFEYDGEGRSRSMSHRTRPKRSSSPVTVNESRSGAGCSRRPTYRPQ